MGCGSFSTTAYAAYNTSLGRDYDYSTGRLSTHSYTSTRLKEGLDPRNFSIRECVNSEEHPNTIPVILGLDVTGSMGSACEETAKALGTIITGLFDKIKDVEFCIMGIGDIECDDAPIQMSQFESDVRIAEALDDLYMEHGGGGNGYESYTAAWYMGLKRTKLDCYDKQGRKGIIITMGDEPLNPILKRSDLNDFISGSEESDISTEKLFEEASKKFDIYHISINDRSSSYAWHESEINRTFKPLLKERYFVSTIDELASTIEKCVLDSVGHPVKQPAVQSGVQLNENGEITW